jgi:protein AATF/BFR2
VYSFNINYFLQDFDPEDIGTYQSENEDGESNCEVAPDAGREHYETVTKSRLRKPQTASLGPRYAGSKVRRDTIDEGDDDDPFSRGFAESGSERDEGNLELASSEEEEDEDEANDFDHSSDEEGEEGDSSDITDDEDMEDEGPIRRSQTDEGVVDRAELRKLMAEDQKSVAATLSQSAKADAEKGKAVRSQRATFDSLLNSRIKLQKALVATNSLLAAELTKNNVKEDKVIEAAETAAIKLWDNLNTLRWSLQDSRPGQKRTHREYTKDDSLEALWEESKSYETAQKKLRTTAIDFWASKTRATTSLPQARGRLQQPAKEQLLSDVLAGQMADMGRLVAKTQVPRSCAPVQAASASKRTNGSTNVVHHDKDEAEKLPIYDDADFYTTLLANLISQRSTDATVNMSNVTIQPWQAAREAKTKKVVDTKASKGRKLRYTVHEKLVSFMAPEDRGLWGHRQSDELFGSLFGRRIALAEVEDIDKMDENKEVEGLRLFGRQ